MQTINSITAVIDWVYVDESRVAFHYTISGLNWPDGVRLGTTSMQISSTMVENMGTGAYGGSSLPVDDGGITGSFDQLLIDGTLRADEHPNIALDLDIPVNGTNRNIPSGSRIWATAWATGECFLAGSWNVSFRANRSSPQGNPI